MNIEQTKLTPPQVARMWGISVDKVLTWIRNGELPAINAAATLNGRPRYLVDTDALDSFERRRQVAPKTSPVRRRRERRQDVVKFF